MFLKGLLAKCPFWRNTTVNPFQQGVMKVEEARGLCPFVKKNFSTMNMDEIVAQAHPGIQLDMNLDKSKCPFMKEKVQVETKPKAKKVDYYKKCKDAVLELKNENRYRTFIDVKRHNGDFPIATRRTETGEKEDLTVWCSNDYLGMGQHPKVIRAMMKAIDESGAGAGGTRNIGGNTRYIVDLETRVAQLHNKERGMVGSSCYVVNEAVLSTLPSIIGKDTIYFSDSANHASLIHGMRNSRAARKVWRHNDVDHLEQLLQESDPSVPKVIVFESVYSMSGSVSPIDKVIALAKKYNALTFLDEVHAVALYGPTGAGYAEKMGVADDIDLISGTLGKGFGVFGGYVVGKDSMLDAVRSNAAGFIFTTSLPPCITAAAQASIDHLTKSSTERENHQKQTRQLLRRLLEENLPVMHSQSHIIPLFIGDPRLTKTVSDILLDRYKVYVQPINYPTVPKGEERLRLSPSPLHTNEMIEHFVGSAKQVWGELGLKMLSDYLKDEAMVDKFYPQFEKKMKWTY